MPQEIIRGDVQAFSPIGILQKSLVYMLLALVTYLAFVAVLRFQRRHTLHKTFSRYATRESMKNMTDHDAWLIQKTIMQTEFPFIVLKSLQFALFRVRETLPRSIHMIDENRHMAFPRYQRFF